MKKLILISAIITILTTGCGKDKKTLKCTQNNEEMTITIENKKITKTSMNGEEEEVNDEQWETLKNFYEFNDDITNDEIVNKLKELNESIGYTCTVK